MADDGEDFTVQTDWGAMVVFGFEAFAADFCKGMTGERSVATSIFLSTPVPSPLFLPLNVCNMDRREATLFGRNDLDLKIWTLSCEAGVWCGWICLDVGPQGMYNTEYLVRQAHYKSQFMKW